MHFLWRFHKNASFFEYWFGLGNVQKSGAVQMGLRGRRMFACYLNIHLCQSTKPIQMRCVLQISSRSHQATAIAWQHKKHEKEMTRMSLNGKAKWHQCRVPFSGRGFPSLVCLTAFGSAIQHRGHSVAVAFLEESIFEQMWYRRANIFLPSLLLPVGLSCCPCSL